MPRGLCANHVFAKCAYPRSKRSTTPGVFYTGKMCTCELVRTIVATSARSRRNPRCSRVSEWTYFERIQRPSATRALIPHPHFPRIARQPDVRQPKCHLTYISSHSSPLTPVRTLLQC